MSDWKNVNNWHWTTKDCLNWAKEYFSTNFSGVSAEHDGIKVKIDSLEDCSGDVDLSNRKGKVITIFDVQLTFNWSGTGPADNETSGTVNIPEVAHDTDPDDFVFEISAEDESKEAEPIKDVVRKHLVPQLKEKLRKFPKDLVENHSKDVYTEPLQLGTKAPPRAATPTSKVSESTSRTSVTSAPNKKIVNTAKITDTIEFQASADQLYETYLNPSRVAIWTKAKPELARHVGGEFSLFGGNITGVFTELIPNQRIAQTWRLNYWPEGHYSKVVLTFDQMSDFTRINITHEGVPIGEEEIVRRNWVNYYWNPIKSVFGYAFFNVISSVDYSSSSSASSSTPHLKSSKSKPQKSRRQKRHSRKNSSNKGHRLNGGGGVAFGFTVALVLTAIVLGFVLSRSTSVSS